jgi:hypothetical protein
MRNLDRLGRCPEARARERVVLSVPDRRRISETPTGPSRRQPRHHRVDRSRRRASPPAPQPAAPAWPPPARDRDDRRARGHQRSRQFSRQAQCHDVAPRTQIQPFGQPSSGISDLRGAEGSRIPPAKRKRDRSRSAAGFVWLETPREWGVPAGDTPGDHQRGVARLWSPHPHLWRGLAAASAAL